MEFEDEEHEEQEEEDAIPITSYNPLKMPVTGTRSSSSSSPPPSPLSLSIPPVMSPSAAKKPPARYRECLKNHAVGMGGHAVDGCGEFMPAGADGTIDALKCAACNCHRNFHRKEVDPAAAQNHQAVAPIAFYPHPHQPPPPHHPAFQFNSYSRTSPGAYRPLALPAAGGGGEEREREMTMISNPMAAMGLGSSGKKRFRTKFTAEQKEKMLELAEKIGWRFQKQDEEAIQHFCHETGLKRKVLKVWMHNNKQNYLGKKP